VRDSDRQFGKAVFSGEERQVLKLSRRLLISWTNFSG
jgi:hypothetical protein